MKRKHKLVDVSWVGAKSGAGIVYIARPVRFPKEGIQLVVLHI